MEVFGSIASGTPITFPAISYSGLAPEILLVAGALVSMVVSSLTSLYNKSYVYSALGIGFAAVAGAWSFHLYRTVESNGASSLVGGSIALDGFSTFFWVLICVGLILTILLGESFVYKVGTPGPDFVSLLLLSGSGAMFMASANDLIVLFLGLEILSIALYVLVGYTSRRSSSREAAFKYFILGGFSSAIFLYGIALVYGATGSTNIGQIALFLSSSTLTSNGVLLGGIALIIVGLGFKVAAAPFQLWTPDVYQGAPTTVSGYMAAVAKAAGFAGLLRVLYVSFATLRADWRPIILTLSLLSLFGGALLALTQRDVKRMLAYSSVNHAGFILLGLYVGTQRSISDSLYYLFVYSIMAIGAFGTVSIIAALMGVPEGTVRLEDLRGLGGRHRRLAVVLSIFLVAQAGAPFTTGFLSKFAIVSAVIHQGEYAVGVAAMASAAIAVYFYLRVVVPMFGTYAQRYHDPNGVELFGDQSPDETSEGKEGSLTASPTSTKLRLPSSDRVPVPAAVAVGLALVVTVGFGIVANPLLQFAYHAVVLH